MIHAQIYRYVYSCLPYINILNSNDTPTLRAESIIFKVKI